MTPKKKAQKITKLKSLYRRRTNILGSANLIKIFDESFDPTKIDQLSIRIQRLDALWREFEETQDEIEVLEDTDDEFSQERLEFQTLHYELKGSLQSKIPLQQSQPPPQFNISQCVDIIIGTELSFNLLEYQQFSLGPGYPTLQKTVFGYVVCGKLDQPPSIRQLQQSCHICVNDRHDTQLQGFWEIESFEDRKALTPDEQHCENHFNSTTPRDKTGRYVVRLPLKENELEMLGDSYTCALRRFQQMKRRFATDEKLRRDYHQFLEEYETLGYMELTSRASCSPQFFLPHQAV
ncbi:uncharacterized protein LOC128740194 [Sabethes cyaneus]|uniref:uncharacterized protein LOC128740194 n=1 Tax=Sabethes cyaneus TaxID=53552 RepID=UPI00237E292D|nr:uncharacterized protein LOC128740194 [Sabethes cyaneus]